MRYITGSWLISSSSRANTFALPTLLGRWNYKCHPSVCVPDKNQRRKSAAKITSQERNESKSVCLSLCCKNQQQKATKISCKNQRALCAQHSLCTRSSHRQTDTHTHVSSHTKDNRKDLLQRSAAKISRKDQLQRSAAKISYIHNSHEHCILLLKNSTLCGNAPLQAGPELGTHGLQLGCRHLGPVLLHRFLEVGHAAVVVSTSHPLHSTPDMEVEWVQVVQVFRGVGGPELLGSEPT